jgi:hypothetical protein
MSWPSARKRSGEPSAATKVLFTEFLAKPISAKSLHQRILNVVVNPRPFIKTKSYFGLDRRRNVNPAVRAAGTQRKAPIQRQVPRNRSFVVAMW